MEFFNSLINDVQALVQNLPKKCFSYKQDDAWNDIGCTQVILQRDTAFELNGTGFNLITSSPVKDEIIVIGDDIPAISQNRSFARISIIQIENEEDEQAAYNLIKKIEYVKYHFFPEGYMLRTTSRSHKESVRVAKTAVKKGIDFRKTGNLLINQYKKIAAVKGVTVILITDPDISYSEIEETAVKNNRITETLNHVVNSISFDCNTCNLKAVCDEVEGMKELHFKMNTEMKP